MGTGNRRRRERCQDLFGRQTDHKGLAASGRSHQGRRRHLLPRRRCGEGGAVAGQFGHAPGHGRPRCRPAGLPAVPRLDDGRVYLGQGPRRGRSFEPDEERHRMKTKRTSTRASGFTLVELLTVIAIVSVLATLVVVTINKVREAARGTQNLANHRTIAAALLQSAYDNKGSLPYFDHGSSVKLSYPRYLAERGYVTDYRVFFSPKAGTWYDNYQGALRQPHIATVVPWYFTNYGANRFGAMPHAQDDGSRKPAMLSRIEQPAKLMLLRDTYR